MKLIAQYFLTFMMYSFGGWVIETLLYVIRDKKVVKRGFLLGPLCPIYGTGAVVCTVLLYGKINNIFLLFLTGMLLCGTIEYVTHFVLEKLFHAMWWDYSNRRFSIKGRVYLNGLLQFGFAVVFIIKLLQPFVFKILNMFSDNALYITSFVLYSLLLIDIVATVVDLRNVVESIKYLQGKMIEISQSGLDSAGEKINQNEKIGDLVNKLKTDNSLLMRIKAKYPNINFTKYSAIMDIIMDRPIEEKARKDIKLYGTADTIPTADKNEKENV